MTRDFTERQMLAAAERNEFEAWPLGLKDISDIARRQSSGRKSYGWVMFKDGRGKRTVHYRTSLSEAISKRARDRRRRAKVPA